MLEQEQQAKDQATSEPAEDQEEVDLKSNALVPPAGVSQADFDKLLKHLNDLDTEETDSDELSDDLEDTIAEENEEEVDDQEDVVDLRTNRNENVEPVVPAKPSEAAGTSKTQEKSTKPMPESTSKPSTCTQKPAKKGVRFSSEPLGSAEAAPSAELVEIDPKASSILKNRDEKPRVDRQYADWMNRRFDKKLLPESKAVFKGGIVEKDPLLTLGAPKPAPQKAAEPAQKVSKFKKSRSNV